MMKMKMKIVAVVIILAAVVGCTRLGSGLKGIKSNVAGLNRKVEVYSLNGQLIKTYQGNVLIEHNQYGNNCTILVDNKRIIIDNMSVITEEL